MISIRVDTERDPQVLAELIAQAHGDPNANVTTGEAVAEVHKEILDGGDRPSRQELETVNFQRLDSENDWTDV